MALKDTWIDLEDAVVGMPDSGDEVSAEPINQIAGAVIELEEKMPKKADKSTTLGGYGITDAYTKEEVDGIHVEMVEYVDDEVGVVRDSVFIVGTKLNDLDKKIDEKETILYEDVVNTPEWTNQPTYDGTLDSALNTKDFYYVTLKDADGTSLPDGKFMLKSSFETSATVYSTIFNLSGLVVGTDDKGNSEKLIENYPVEFLEVGTSIKMRSAGLSLWNKTVKDSTNFILNEGLGSVRITVHGEFVQMSTNGSCYPCYYFTNNICSYHTEKSNSFNSDATKQVVPYIAQSRTVYGRNRIFDSFILTKDGGGYFSGKRISVINYGGASDIFYKTGELYGNTITDMETKLNVVLVVVSGKNNGVIRNGTHIRVTEVK